MRSGNKDTLKHKERRYKHVQDISNLKAMAKEKTRRNESKSRRETSIRKDPLEGI